MPAAKAMKKAMKAMKQKAVKKAPVAAAKSGPKKAAKKAPPPPAAPEVAPGRARWTRCGFWEQASDKLCNRPLVKTKFLEGWGEPYGDDGYYSDCCLNDESCSKKFKAGDTVWVCPRVGSGGQLRGLGLILHIF